MQTSDSSNRSPAPGARVAVIVYPFALLLIACLVNLLAFTGDGATRLPVLPSTATLAALSLSAVLLLVNHGWLMTATELTRVRFGLQATPEEWAESGRDPADAPVAGRLALERCHNAHRNTTENVVYSGLAALAFVFASPPVVVAWLWPVGFAAARLLYTGSYLSARTGLRGLAMSLALLCLCGLVSYPALALLKSL